MSATDYSLPSSPEAERSILCGCGCGKPTLMATRTQASKGLVAGKPQRFLNGHSRRSSPIEYLVEDRGYKTPCWIWQRFTDKDGYGRIKHDGVFRGAHAVFYEQKYGQIPNGMMPDHLCRVRPCVNPDHLEPVTCAENTRRGKSSKLIHSDVIKIRLMLSQHKTCRDIAPCFGVSEALISRIKRGLVWRDTV